MGPFLLLNSLENIQPGDTHTFIICFVPTKNCIVTYCFSITDNCNTAPYLKSDGSYVCGFVLPSLLNMANAATQCTSMGGRLPEAKSSTDSQYLQILFYVGYSSFSSICKSFIVR